jgi:hypothetical protein
MPATVTLSSTTLAADINGASDMVSVASRDGLYPGRRMYVEGELMAVLDLGPASWVKVRRGVDGTAAAPHLSSAAVWIGRADQFYSSDPVGDPPPAIPVSPYINAENGTIWFAQGDNAPGGGNRWWQKQVATYGTSALGARTVTFDPTSST